MANRFIERLKQPDIKRGAAELALGMLSTTGIVFTAVPTINMFFDSSSSIQPAETTSVREDRWLGFGLTELSIPLSIGAVVVSKKLGKWVLQKPSIDGEQPLRDRCALTDNERATFGVYVSEFNAKPLSEDEQSAFEDLRTRFNEQ